MGTFQNRFIIVGGGIGGLATALGLAKHGVRSIVLEKAPKLGEIGAGIQLGPNAFHGFDYFLQLNTLYQTILPPFLDGLLPHELFHHQKSTQLKWS